MNAELSTFNFQLSTDSALAGTTRIYLQEQPGGVPLALAEGGALLCLELERWRLGYSPLLWVYPAGRQQMLQATTRLGRRLRATRLTALLTLAGWRALGELRPGALVALPRRLPSAEEPGLSKAELALLAYLAGERYVAGDPPFYRAASEQLAGDLGRLARRVVGAPLRPQVEREGPGWRVVLAEGGRRVPALGVLAAWRARFELEERAELRRLPAQALAQPLRHSVHLLKHLWADSGSIALRRGHAPEIVYAGASQELARQVQSLLLRLEINAVLFSAGGRQQVHISGKRDLKRFARQIGARDEQDQRRLAALRDYFAERSAITGRDTLPPESWALLIDPAMGASGISALQIQALLGYPPSARPLAAQHLTRERAALIAQAIRSPQLAALAESDVYWDEIISVEDAGEEQAYRVAIDGSDTLIADDIVVGARVSSF